MKLISDILKQIKRFCLVFMLWCLLFPCSAFSAGDLTISSDSFLNAGTYTFDTVTVTNGASLLCKSSVALNTGVVIYCKNLFINSGARVLADSQGYPTGQGPGSPTNGVHGGGYGGYGGGGTGIPYGSITTPTHLGTAGGITAGSNAGGAILIFADNEVQINGILSANGDTGYPCGSGGSIYVRTKTISGTGVISAVGGSSNNFWGGANGGGGRVAVYYESASFNFDSITARAGNGSCGYTNAGCGTVFLKSSAMQNGVLIIPGNYYAPYYLYYTPISGTYSFDTIQLKAYGSAIIPSGSNVTVSNLTSLDTNCILRVDGNLNKDGNVTIGDTVILELNGTHSYTNMTIKKNGKVSHSANYDSQKRYSLNLIVHNNLTIDSGGAIDMTAKGFPATCGPGIGNGDYGGSYGGKGGELLGATSGDTYGSETMPYDLGSGGKSGAGGGALFLTVWGALQVDGSILSDGYTYMNWGNYQGSGGSIYVKAPAFAGNSSGIISAKGGSGGDAGGGGGRIAIYYDTNTFSGTYAYNGGTAWTIRVGDTGTLYLKKSLFHLPPEIPSIDNPSYSSPIPGKRPTFKWTVPRDEENDTLYFEIEITQDSSFSSAPTVLASSLSSQDGFLYSADNGINWTAYPPGGVVSNTSPALKVSYTVQQDLWVGNWYWRVRAKAVDGYSNWSELGYLPSIVGDLIVKITSPANGISVYDTKITVQGRIEQSVWQMLTVNSVTENITLTDTRFSVEADLRIGENVITASGTGILGSYVSDTIVIYRLKVPSKEGESNVGTSGGTMRIDDFDTDPDNDARIEISDGVFDRDVKIEMKVTEGDYPVYEIKVNGMDSYKLKKKVKLVLSYKNMKTDAKSEERLRIFLWDGMKWQLVGGEVNRDKKLVSIYTYHFSRYAVMLLPEGKNKEAVVSPAVFTPNSDGINDYVIFNVMNDAGGKLEIKIYDVNGRLVRSMEDEGSGTGVSLVWDGQDANGKMSESGIYFYVIAISSKTLSTGTIVIAK